MNKDIAAYHNTLTDEDKEICDLLYTEIKHGLPEAEDKVWHGHPVWFLNDNPIVGYSNLKDGIRLMFWSGMDFEEPSLQPGSGKFKDASIMYHDVSEIDKNNLERWLEKSRRIQWDYKNIVKRKGKLEKLF